MVRILLRKIRLHGKNRKTELTGGRTLIFRGLLKNIYLIGLFCILVQFVTGSAAAVGRMPVGGLILPESLQEVLVRYRPGATFSDITNTYRQYNLNEVSYSPFNGTRRLRIAGGHIPSSIAAVLRQNPLVAYAEPNYLRAAHFMPNDPLYIYQWHLNNRIMEQAWDISIGTNVIVAVLDTGVSYRNAPGFARAPDLRETAFRAGYDFVNNDPYPDDDNSHGTHITGTIAQSFNNLYGGAGVAPGCTIMPVKVLDAAGIGDTADIVDGIYYAANNGAQIINMSLGAPRVGGGRKGYRSNLEEEAIEYAVSQGVTVICSAGNNASSQPSYPAAYEVSISVTACTYDQSFASAYSNYGAQVDICAPGGDMDQDLNGDGYPDGIYQQTHDGVNYQEFDFYYADGTSSASAFVSGVATLVLSCSPKPLTPSEVRQILQNSAIDLGDPGWDQYYGWGVVDPLAAVQSAITYAVEGRFLPYRVNAMANRFLGLGANFSLNTPLIPTGELSQVSRQTNAVLNVLPLLQTLANTRDLLPLTPSYIVNIPFAVLSDEYQARSEGIILRPSTCLDQLPLNWNFSFPSPINWWLPVQFFPN